MLPRITILIALLAGATTLARAGSALFPISRSSVRDAIVKRFGDDLSAAMPSPEAIQIPSTPQAHAQNPKLVVQALERALNRGTFYVRIRCQPVTDCVPFLVELRFPDEVANRLQSALRKSAPHPRAPIIVRAGSRPSLVLNRGDVHISLPVRALQAGRSGQRIRVSSDDTGKFYWARVVSATQVEGSY